MVEIQTFFETFLDNELYAKLQERSNVIRLYCMIKFKTKDGFTEPYPAIIDTGAHTSLLPLRIWKLAEHRIFCEHYIKGLVPNTKLDVKVGEVNAILVDVLNKSREYKFLSYFSPSDETPLILGFKELLSKLKISINYKSNRSYIIEE